MQAELELESVVRSISRVSAAPGRFLATILPLKPIQIVNRVWRKLLPARVRPVVGARRRAIRGAWCEPFPEKAIATRGVARFLNVERDIESPKIWNDPACSRLWLYQLHYFNGIAAAAGADPCAGDFVKRWILENPPVSGVGWEPFPVSLRVGNWIKFALQGGQLDQEALDSLATQTRWLRDRLEYHLLGNHLLLNACALYSAGCFLEGRDADGWRAKGVSLLEKEIRNQVLPDGMHFELSPMYQLLVLGALLDVVNVSRAFAQQPPKNLRGACRAMLSALQTLMHPDGGIAQFNDSALDEAPTPEELREYANRLGLGDPQSAPVKSTWLPDAGYARLCGDGAVALIDVAEIGPSYLPAHAHADTFTFELSVRGRRVVIDTGISTYEAGPARERERGTAAHNTVSIDGRDSSQVWHAFRVGSRARILRRRFDASGDATVILGAHDGYRAMGVVHARTWTMRPDHMEIVDEISGRGTHLVECAFHLHPDCRVELDVEGARIAMDGRSVLRIALPAQLTWAVTDYECHPGFGVSRRAQRLCGRRELATPVKLMSVLHWGEGKTA